MSGLARRYLASVLFEDIFDLWYICFMVLDFSHEGMYGGLSVGIDEVGRGPLAGPVVAASVVLPLSLVEGGLLSGLRDSKQLSESRREYFGSILLGGAFCGIGISDVGEILDLNILGATMLAMRRSFVALSSEFDVGGAVDIEHAFVDGNCDPGLGIGTTCMVGGDDICLSIAAASVVAKQHRDSIMRLLSEGYPAYGWERNKGYGTSLHREALREHGLTPHHRVKFCEKIMG